jgi:hypothetical protein
MLSGFSAALFTIIAGNSFMCAYPINTVIRRNMLPLRRFDLDNMLWNIEDPLKNLEGASFRIADTHTIPPGEATNPGSEFGIGTRWFGDFNTWSWPLFEPKLSDSIQTFSINTWNLRYDRFDEVTVDTLYFRHSSLRRPYTVANIREFRCLGKIVEQWRESSTNEHETD